MDRQTQRCPQRPGSSPTSNLTCHAGRLAQMASHRSKFRVLKIKSQPVTTRRRSPFCPHEEVRKLDPKKLKSSLRLHTRLKLAEALPTTLMSIVHRPTWPGSAHTTCHGTHQTSMPLVRGEHPGALGSRTSGCGQILDKEALAYTSSTYYVLQKRCGDEHRREATVGSGRCSGPLTGRGKVLKHFTFLESGQFCDELLFLFAGIMRPSGRSLVPGASAHGQGSTCHSGHFFNL